MSYVPPHKRVSKAQDAPPPTPAQMIPRFKKSLNIKNSSRHGSGHKADKSTSTSYMKKIVYAHNSTSRWLAVPSIDDLQRPSSLSLVPVCLDFVGQKTGEIPLTLVNDHLQQGLCGIKSCDLEHIWAPVVETVHADLMSAFENLRNELMAQNLEETKPKIVARFGKVLFRGDPSLKLDLVKENLVSESFIKGLKRVFHTNLTSDYMEHIKNVVIPQLSIQSEEEKELYHVKLADTKRPDSTISCKCKVRKDEDKLELYKIELNQVRNLVEDISCLESNMDLRLALCTKRILVTLQDEELQSIRDLISSATFDPNVKGGLRWPLGKANSGGQYSVVGVWHTKTKAYNSSVIRLRMREADRFNFLSTTGEVSSEIILMLTGITKSLLEQKCEAGSIMTMLEDAVKLIQKHFLAWDGSLLSCSES